MADTVRVESIDVLRAFRTVLVKFSESANVALSDAESELQRVAVWLDTEQQSFWQHQVRQRTEAVTAAKDKVREKKLYKDSTGRQQSAIDEEKALKVAQRRLLEAEEKLAHTRKWARRMQHELHNYKGGVQRFATMLMVDVPTAVAKLDKLAGSLEKYVGIGPSLVGSTTNAASTTAPAGPAAEGLPSVTRQAEEGDEDEEKRRDGAPPEENAASTAAEPPATGNG